jgi:hypothetical protein
MLTVVSPFHQWAFEQTERTQLSARDIRSLTHDPEFQAIPD